MMPTILLIRSLHFGLLKGWHDGKKHGVEEFCFIKLVVIIPPILSFSLCQILATWKHHYLIPKKREGIGIVLFFEERCGKRESIKCGRGPV